MTIAVDSDRIARIAGLPLFTGLDRDRIDPILARCATRHLASGDLLLSPGQSNNALFLLLTGRVLVRLDAADSAFGFAIEAGEMVGEMSVIDGQPASAFVLADGACEILVLDEHCLWQQLAPLPGFMRNLLRLITERLRARNEAIFVAQKNRLRFEEMERELATARELQAAMLPSRMPTFPGFDVLDVHAVMEPAKEVGGDFYDVLAIGPHHVCIVIGDVSGKGMSAALFMVRVLTLLRSEARGGDPIEVVVSRVNDALAADNPTCMFVTLCVLVVDVRDGEAVLVNGGHNAPIANLGGAGWAYMSMPEGPLVGVIDRAPFEVARFTLRPGDRVVLYTDGVTEAENAQLQHYSAERLRDDLAHANPVDAETAMQQVRARVTQHADGQAQSDDITIVALKWKGQAAGAMA